MNLIEHFVTAWNNDNKTKGLYFNDVIDILEKSYEPIGGLISLPDRKEILNSQHIWKLVTRNNKVTACIIYKGKANNRKLILAGTDGSKQGKEDLKLILKDDIRDLRRGTWGELSGAMEHIYLDTLKGNAVPKEISSAIMQVLGKDARAVSDNSDKIHYTRTIGGQKHQKAMVGNPPKEFVNKAISGEFIDLDKDNVDDDVAEYISKLFS